LDDRAIGPIRAEAKTSAFITLFQNIATNKKGKQPLTPPCKKQYAFIGKRIKMQKVFFFLPVYETSNILTKSVSRCFIYRGEHLKFVDFLFIKSKYIIKGV